MTLTVDWAIKLTQLNSVFIVDFLEEEELILGEVPCEDVDLPSLNESFDIETTLGSLRLQSSTPVKPSL